jgi:GT2 family glycosyltransferase
LTSVLAQTYQDWQLYLYDNNSPSRQQLEPLLADFPSSKLNYLALADNYGFAVANNLAIRQAFADGCDAVVIINNDTIFAPDLLTKLVAEAKQYNALIVAPKMLYYPDDNLVWYAGGYFDSCQALKNIHIGIGEIDDKRFDIPSWQDFAPMCCLLVDRQVFEQIGYLDENYFIYYEDADWAYRAKLVGIAIWYAPNARLYHKVSSLTGGAKSDFTIYHATRSKVYFIYKFYSGWRRYYWLSIYLCGFIIGLISRRYSCREVAIKLRGFFSRIV